jgi:hypothetical protein
VTTTTTTTRRLALGVVATATVCAVFAAFALVPAAQASHTQTVPLANSLSFAVSAATYNALNQVVRLTGTLTNTATGQVLGSLTLIINNLTATIVAILNGQQTVVGLLEQLIVALLGTGQIANICIPPLFIQILNIVIQTTAQVCLVVTVLPA